MKLSTILTLALVATAVTLLFTTEKGNEYRDTAMEGAKKWGKKLRRKTGELAENVPNAAGIMADAVV